MLNGKCKIGLIDSILKNIGLMIRVKYKLILFGMIKRISSETGWPFIGQKDKDNNQN
jgi:hypothetical protein